MIEQKLQDTAPWPSSGLIGSRKCFNVGKYVNIIYQISRTEYYLILPKTGETFYIINPSHVKTLNKSTIDVWKS